MSVAERFAPLVLLGIIVVLLICLFAPRRSHPPYHRGTHLDGDDW